MFSSNGDQRKNSSPDWENKQATFDQACIETNMRVPLQYLHIQNQGSGGKEKTQFNNVII